MSKLGGPTYKEIREIIKELNRYDLDDADYLEIRGKVYQLLTEVFFAFKALDTGTELFRARVSKKKLRHVGDIGSPPDAAVKNFQRCNPPGKSRFYCAENEVTAIREIGAEVGDIVYVGSFNTKESALCAMVPPDQDVSIDDPRRELIAAFFETKFAQPVHDVFSSQYKITAAIFDEFTSRKITHRSAGLGEANPAIQDDVRSLLYPSSCSPIRARCVAFDASYAKKILRFNYILQLKITGIHKNRIEKNQIDVGVTKGNNRIVWGQTPGETVVCW